jgi:hypothetical protein
MQEAPARGAMVFGQRGSAAPLSLSAVDDVCDTGYMRAQSSSKTFQDTFGLFLSLAHCLVMHN